MMKISASFPPMVQKRYSGTKTPTSWHEKTLCQRGLIFWVDVHTELTPPPSACVHLSLKLSLSVDFINGWSLQLCMLLGRS